MKKEDEKYLEEDFDTQEAIDTALEDDEISSEEAGFMKGFLEEDE